MLGSGVLYGFSNHTQQQSFGQFNPTGGGTYYLQSSINATQTTVALSSFTEPGSNIPYTMTYLNSDIEYATINPTSANTEFISFTGITQNSNGTALLTGVTRGLERSYPYAASSTLAHSAPGQTQLILSSPPQFFNEYASKRNSQVISGQWQFTTVPTSSIQCASADQFCNKQYVDNLALQGAATSTFASMGLVQLATSLQMASGTASSTTQKPLVISPKFSTTTPGVQCTGGVWNCLPVANIAGKLAQSWLDLTQAFTWSGLHTFSAGLLGTASSTFNAGTLHVGGTVIAPHFGGTGTDGALAISSGTTTIALGTNNYYEKNYTTISLTGTGALNFSSAATSTSGITVVLKSQGACTFTSSSMTMIDVRWLGGGQGTGWDALGTATNSFPGMGGGGGGSTGGKGADGGASFTTTAALAIGGNGGVQLPALASSTLLALPGGNGGGGGGGSGASSGAGGVGGRGGGGIYIECGGGYTFTTGGFMAKGADGAASGAGTGSNGGGGGGGGAGGNIFVRAASIVSDSGTYTTTAGNGGTGNGSGGSGATAAAGSHLEVINSTNF